MRRSFRTLAALAFLFGLGLSQSHAQLATTGAGLGAPAVAPSTTTWNPSDKSANITLSGGNLVVTMSSSSRAALRGVASHSAGKYYWEDTFNFNPGASGNEFFMGGIANSTTPLTDFCGQDINSLGADPGGGIFWVGGSTTSGVASVASGDTLAYALDLTNSRFWVSIIHLGVRGLWNNVGGADPATNTLGIDISTLAAGPYFPCDSFNAAPNTSAVTTNFGATAFVAPATVPVGFGNW